MEERTVVDPGFGPAGYGAPQSPYGMPGGEATQVLPGGAAGYAQPGYATPGYDVTQQAVGQTCAVCQTPNPPMERYCQDCGFMFGSAANGVTPVADPGEAARLTDATGREFVLESGVSVVGRESVDIVLMDPTVSRRHGQVRLEGTQVIVEDLGSTNGTFVGGRQIRPGEQGVAFHGEIVKFGSVQLTLSLPGAPARPAALPPPSAPQPSSHQPGERGALVAHAVMPDGSEFSLYAGANSVGRRSGNDVVLVDAFASGRHAEIQVSADGQATIVDAGSTNGTFLNGERLAAHAPVTLAPGQAVTFGKTAITVRVAEGSPAELPAATGGDSGAPDPTRALNREDAAPSANATMLP